MSVLPVANAVGFTCGHEVKGSRRDQTKGALQEKEECLMMSL